ncbi:MAG: DUF5689 domain-containing protein [Prevotella sp.]|jgi:hypothetical protein
MKTFRYLLLLAMACSLNVACMDGDYDETSDSEVQAKLGNDSIEETNLVTIAQLKEQYSSVIRTSYSYEQITTDMQIKGYVTGNDIQGNMYQEIALQDSTGAIIIPIEEGGLCGYLPLGAEVLVSLKDLYIGNYGKQAEIGVPYTNARGNTYVSRMNRYTWYRHFKLTGNSQEVEPEEFADGSTRTTWDLDEDDGKLGVIKNVTISGANGTATYANYSAGPGNVSVYFKEQPSSVLMYNSNYADFAGDIMPTGKVNVTGVVKRYNSTWEFIIRKIDDVEEVN